MKRIKILSSICLVAFLCVLAPLTAYADTMVDYGMYDVPIYSEQIYNINNSSGASRLVFSKTYGPDPVQYAPLQIRDFAFTQDYYYLFLYNFINYTVSSPAIIEVVFNYTGDLRFSPYYQYSMTDQTLGKIAGNYIQVYDVQQDLSHIYKAYYYEDRHSIGSDGVEHGQLIIRFAIPDITVLYGDYNSGNGYTYRLGLAFQNEVAKNVSSQLVSFQAVPTTQAIVDAINGVNDTISTSTQAIVDAINNSSSVGGMADILNPSLSDEERLALIEQKKNEQTAELDNLVSEMDKLEKPTAGAIIKDSNEYISSDSVGELGVLLKPFTENTIVLTSILSVLSIALVAYVLFGKR